MVPRGGEIYHFPREESRLDKFTVDGASLGDVFVANAADALVVGHGDTLYTSRTGTDGRAPPAHLVFHDQSLARYIAGILVSGQLDRTKARPSTCLNWEVLSIVRQYRT